MRWLIALILAALLAIPRAYAADPDRCATPSVIASPVAGADSCSWSELVAAVNREIIDREFDRLSIGPAEPAIESRYLPDGWIEAATWGAELPAGGGAHWTSLLQYDSPATLTAHRTAFELTLKAEFFVPPDRPALDGLDACFVLIREESARAVCLFERGDFLIVGYSFFEVDFADAQLANAIALAQLIDEALEAVDAGTRLR